MIHFENELDNLKSIGQHRSLRNIESLPYGRAQLGSEQFINLSSNDYLGLATNGILVDEFQQWLSTLSIQNPYGATSSRLLTGNNCLYTQIETALEGLYLQPALFFNSGYHANMGILPALTTKDDLILSDKLVHASLIDGIRLSSATHIRYRHLDYNQLEKLLSEKRDQYRCVYIVTESVFSMDGDLSDLNRLIAIKQQYDAMLYVDEAHAVGTHGVNGLGLAEQMGVNKNIDLLVGTMGKAFASVGAWVNCNQTVKDLLINKCRTLIFTTALPPINLAWSLFIIQKIAGFHQLRQELTNGWSHLSRLLNDNGIVVNVQSHIVPIVVGDNTKALCLANALQQQGFIVIAVRPPTVPVGTARLRLSLTANITESIINQFVDKLIYCLKTTDIHQHKL